MTKITATRRTANYCREDNSDRYGTDECDGQCDEHNEDRYGVNVRNPQGAYCGHCQGGVHSKRII